MMCKLDLVQMLYLRLVLFGTGLNAAVGLIAKLHIFLQKSCAASELSFVAFYPSHLLEASFVDLTTEHIHTIPDSQRHHHQSTLLAHIQRRKVTLHAINGRQESINTLARMP
ncbi:hypothetical protein HBH70_121080 [Parastagonospora nodorum]|nr:hypothetical protein HBI09_108120 [Parastagonospora nodorum]KAH4120460.1 hypothetical protein HBH47_113040 [Parastagonospora nodorum]KAH4311669.1 hypothetical protein HBI01_013350 [Parastagonospora nodorum]KAH4316669.1 hypothetical protein HBI02_029670 [Parastagonospora nodorum]KAH4328413.1 hypothetical protein HBI00_112770 [Parastagonospora nodorum]